MDIEIGTKRKTRLFYGWWLVLAGFIVVVLGVESQAYTTTWIPLFLDKVHSVSIYQTGIAIAVFNFAGTIALLAIGPLIDRFGPRKLMLIGIPIAGVSFIALGFSNSFFTIPIILGTLAIGLSAAFVLPVQTATANWFIKRRSIALAIICASSVLGGSTASLMGRRITDLFDFQGAFLGLGIVILLIGIPLALVIRHRPEQYGFLPDNRLPTINETSQPAIEQDNLATEVNISLMQALRTKSFWMLTIAMGLIAGMRHIARLRPVYLNEQGFDVKADSNISDLAFLIGLLLMLLFGFLGDKFPKRYLLAIAIALQSISVVVLMSADNFPRLYVYTLFNSFGSGIVPLILAIRADYFGRKAFATITAVMGFASTIIYLVLTILDSLVLKITVSFQIAMLLSMFVGFIAAAVFFFAKPPEPTQRALVETES